MSWHNPYLDLASGRAAGHLPRLAGHLATGRRSWGGQQSAAADDDWSTDVDPPFGHKNAIFRDLKEGG